jgi:hypothetical protein
MLKNGFVKIILIYWGKIVKLYDRPVSLLNSQFEPALKSKTIERGETKSLRQKSIEQLIFEQ